MEKYKADVVMYNKKIFVNTEDGTGFKEVLESISPLINSMSKKYSLPCHDYHDMKSMLNLIAIEGIHSYIPNENLKLSSYLTTYLKNKMITKIVLNNTKKKDASFIKIIDNNEKNKKVSQTISITELGSGFSNCDGDYQLDKKFSYLFKKENDLIFQNYFIKIIDELTEERLKENKIRPIIKKYIELIYFDGYTLANISREYEEKYYELAKDIRKLSNLPEVKKLMDIYKDNYLEIYNEG